MVALHHQNVGQNHVLIINKSYENVPKFKRLGTAVTNRNYIYEEIKSGLNSGSAWYHSVQCLLSPRLLSKNLKIKTYKTIIVPVVLHGCKTLSVTLREEHRVSEKRELRRIFVSKREEVAGD